VSSPYILWGCGSELVMFPYWSWLLLMHTGAGCCGRVRGPRCSLLIGVIHNYEKANAVVGMMRGPGCMIMGGAQEQGIPSLLTSKVMGKKPLMEAWLLEKT
jgi:hypothetical protein